MNIAIITAAGSGKRMSLGKNKILLNLVDKPIIEHTLDVFERCNLINEIILVGDESELSQFKTKKARIVTGGKYRQDSVHNGIKSIENAKPDDIILIHNAANPFITESLVKDTIEAAARHGAAAAAFPAKDTIKQATANNFVEKTLDRAMLWHMQTPQAIQYSIAVEAFEKARQEKFYATDDTALVERLGRQVKLVKSSRENFKITYPADLDAANFIKSSARIGIGIDSHRFANESDEPRPLILGGITIPNHQGLKANSDGDVLLHSLFNAVSSSIGKGSISHYADDLCLIKGIRDSREYIKIAYSMLREEGYKINNIAISIEAKTPKLEPHIPKIKNAISELTGLDTSSIGITATSGEGLTAFGKGEGIQVTSAVSVTKNENKQDKN